jgi:hypothetical protein
LEKNPFNSIYDFMWVLNGVILSFQVYVMLLIRHYIVFRQPIWFLGLFMVLFCRHYFFRHYFYGAIFRHYFSSNFFGSIFSGTIFPELFFWHYFFDIIFSGAIFSALFLRHIFYGTIFSTLFFRPYFSTIFFRNYFSGIIFPKIFRTFKEYLSKLKLKLRTPREYISWCSCLRYVVATFCLQNFANRQNVDFKSDPTLCK